MARVFTDNGAMALASVAGHGGLFDGGVGAWFFWINRTAAPAAERGVVGMGDFTTDKGWWVNLTATGLISALMPFATANRVLTSTVATTLNGWTPVVVNSLGRGTATTQFELYLNGVRDNGTSTSTGSGAAPTNGAFAVKVGPGPGTNAAANTTAPPAQLAMLAYWNRPLTATEAAGLAAGEHPSNYPEGLVEVFDLDSGHMEEGFFRRVYLVPGATNPAFATSPAIVAPYRDTPRIVILSGNVLIAGLGDLQLTGFAPSLGGGISAGLGALSLTGFAPSLNQKINAATGALSLTGFAPSLDQKINAALGQLVLTGFAPSLDSRLNAAVGQLVLNGFAASPVVGTNLIAQLGALDLTGFAPTVDVTNNISILAGLGQLLIAGFAPDITGQDTTTPVAGTGPSGDRRMALMEELRELQQTLAQEKEPQHKGFRDDRVVKRRKEIEAALRLEQKREAARLAAEVAAENEDEEGLLNIILNFLGGSDVS